MWRPYLVKDSQNKLFCCFLPWDEDSNKYHHPIRLKKEKKKKKNSSTYVCNGVGTHTKGQLLNTLLSADWLVHHTAMFNTSSIMKQIFSLFEKEILIFPSGKIEKKQFIPCKEEPSSKFHILPKIKRHQIIFPHAFAPRRPFPFCLITLTKSS